MATGFASQVGAFRCDLGGQGTAEAWTSWPVLDNADWVPLAIFDRLGFLIAHQYQKASANPDLHLRPITGSSSPAPEKPPEIPAPKKVIEGIAHWAARQVDVFFVQESKFDSPLGYTKFSSGVGDNEDASIWIKKELVNADATAQAVDYLKTLRASFAKGARDIGGDFEGEAAKTAAIAKDLWPLRGSQNTYTKTAKRFWRDGDANRLTVAVAGATLLVSTHTDSLGYTCGEVLVMARMLQDMMGSDVYSLFVGGDMNVQPSAKNGALDESQLLKFADKMGLAYPVKRPAPHTVNKQRSFVQLQLLKAGKVDRVFKDWLFHRKSGADNKAFDNNEFDELPNYEVVNNPMHPSIFLPGQFPTNEFPVDHFVVFQKREKVVACEKGLPCSIDRGVAAGVEATF
jgi:hypothetical protein